MTLRESAENAWRRGKHIGTAFHPPVGRLLTQLPQRLFPLSCPLHSSRAPLSHLLPHHPFPLRGQELAFLCLGFLTVTHVHSLPLRPSPNLQATSDTWQCLALSRNHQAEGLHSGLCSTSQGAPPFPFFRPPPQGRLRIRVAVSEHPGLPSTVLGAFPVTYYRDLGSAL